MKYFYGGYRGGRMSAIAYWCKVFSRSLVVVPDLQSMDNMILHGVKPSQLKMPSEFNNDSSLAITSIADKECLMGETLECIIFDERVKHGGNQ